jgi:hypothetical protein
MIHGSILSILSSFYLMGKLDIEVWKYLQCIPIGYCIYDTIINLGYPQLYSKTEKIIFFHHCLFLYTSYILFPHYPNQVSLAYLAETSNPFLHLCYHLLHTPHGKRYPSILYISAIGLVITFFIFRILTYSYLVWWAIFSTSLPELMAIIIFDMMNIYWFIKIIKSIANKNIEKKF